MTFKDLKDYNDIEDVDTELKGGYQKTLFCAQQAKRGGLDYFSVDTLCIDKAYRQAFQSAVDSMLR